MTGLVRGIRNGLLLAAPFWAALNAALTKGEAATTVRALREALVDLVTALRLGGEA